MIGVFDSGVGGLTVVKELIKHLPERQIIYFGDTARLPYGTKQAELIRRWSLHNANWLVEQGAELIVIACHTASSWAFELLRQEIKKPVFDMATPGIEEALSVTRNKKIGIIGTPGTIKSGVYHHRLAELEQEAELQLQSCSLFVPIIEEGWMKRPGVREIVQEYLQPLQQSGIDTLVLGCTHYPLLRDIITDVMGPEVSIVDPAESLAIKIKDFLASNEELDQRVKHGSGHQFFFSAQPYHLELISQLCLGQSIKGQIVDND